MSIIQTLSEGIVNRDLKKEGQALLSKWSATGLLEGLDTEQARHNMARLLENQAKELLRESNSMTNGNIEGFLQVYQQYQHHWLLLNQLGLYHKLI